jgi:hypothetical protein
VAARRAALRRGRIREDGMRSRTSDLSVATAVALLASGLALDPAKGRADERPRAPATVDFSGRWTLNPELSDDAHEKMREAMEGKRGGGPGGGPPMGPGGGRGGPGRGGRMGPPPGSGGGDPSEAMQPIFEPAEEMTITQSEPEIVVDEKFGRMRTFHPDGKAYKTENGTAELKTQWKDGKLLVETKHARGGKVTETWELVRDRGRLVMTLRLEGGFRPALSLKRVYDRAEPKE